MIHIHVIRAPEEKGEKKTEQKQYLIKRFSETDGKKQVIDLRYAINP